MELNIATKTSAVLKEESKLVEASRRRRKGE